MPTTTIMLLGTRDTSKHDAPGKNMEFMKKDDLDYSNFGHEKENLPHSNVKDLFAQTFIDFHNLKVRTRSLHGDKNSTAWEWVITCKPALGPEGNRLMKEEAPPKKVTGCTLMWWNDNDKITKNHKYMQATNE
ncbi:MAG: hypothetical protein Q9164_000071 [Protoblastenia rupestris]